MAAGVLVHTCYRVEIGVWVQIKGALFSPQKLLTPLSQPKGAQVLAEDCVLWSQQLHVMLQNVSITSTPVQCDAFPLTASPS